MKNKKLQTNREINGIIIIGKDKDGNHYLSKEIIDQLSKKGVLVIGDGTKTIKELNIAEKIKSIEGNISKRVQISIDAHGYAFWGVHYVDDDSYKTSDLLSSIMENFPASSKSNIKPSFTFNIFSCYGGATKLPKNAPADTLLITHAPPDEVTYIYQNKERMLDIYNERHFINLEDEILRVANNLDKAHQTLTISTLKSSYTFRGPERLVYLHSSVQDYIHSNQQNILEKFNLPSSSKLNSISEKQASEFLKGHLHYIIMNKNKHALRSLKEINKESVNIDMRVVLTAALNSAILKGNAEIVALLIDKGANIDAENKYGVTALHWAITNGNAEIVTLLIDKGENVNAKSKDEITGLIRAIMNGNAEIVALLIDKGANVNLKSKYGDALDWAIRLGNTKIVALLIDKGANIVSKINIADVKDKGANIVSKINIADVKDKEGKTALHWAVKNGSVETISLLIECGADTNIKDKEGKTALHWAVENGNTAIIKLLIDKGATIDIEDKESKEGLGWASYFTNNKIVSLLIGKGINREGKINIDVKDKYGNTALHLAVLNSDIETTRLLITKGANPLILNNDGKSVMSLKPEYFSAEAITDIFKQSVLDSDTKNIDNIFKFFFHYKDTMEKSLIKSKIVPVNAVAEYLSVKGFKMIDVDIKTGANFEETNLSQTIFGKINSYLKAHDPLPIFPEVGAASISDQSSNLKITNGNFNTQTSNPGVPTADVSANLLLLGAVGKIVSNIYHYTSHPVMKKAIKVPQDLEEKNHKLYKILVNLSKIPYLCKELNNATKNMSKKRDINDSSEYLEKFRVIEESYKNINKEYFAMTHPVDENKFNDLYKKVKNLNREFQSHIQDSVERFPILAPNQKTRKLSSNYADSVLKTKQNNDIGRF